MVLSSHFLKNPLHENFCFLFLSYLLAVHPHKLVHLIFGPIEIFCQTATPQWSMGSRELSNGTTFVAIGAAVAEFKCNNLISATLLYNIDKIDFNPNPSLCYFWFAIH